MLLWGDRVGSGRVGSGRSGRVGSGRVGSGRVGSGRVGSGRVGSGRVGSGRVGRISCLDWLSRFLTCSITYVTFVFSPTQMFVFLSRYVMFNILISIFIREADSLSFAWLMSAHISAPLCNKWKYA